MDAAKVVERKPARDSGPMVFPFFAEGIRKPRETARAHPNAEVLALDDRSADALRVRCSHNWDYLYGLDFSRAVPALASRWAQACDESHLRSSQILQTGNGLQDTYCQQLTNDVHYLQMVPFDFDAEKAIAAIVHLASREIPGLTKYKICKLLFLADKYHLVRYGRPITGDTVCAMPHGPVPSRTLNILTNAINAENEWMPDDDARTLSDYVEIQRNYHNPHFRSVKAVPDGVLSVSDVAALDAIIYEHGSKAFDELKAMTHELFAYQKAWNERVNNAPVIAYEDLFEEDDEALEGAREEMLENHQLRSAFGNPGV